MDTGEERTTYELLFDESETWELLWDDSEPKSGIRELAPRKKKAVPPPLPRGALRLRDPGVVPGSRGARETFAFVERPALPPPPPYGSRQLREWRVSHALTLSVGLLIGVALSSLYFASSTSSVEHRIPEPEWASALTPAADGLRTVDFEITPAEAPTKKCREALGPKP